MEQDQIFVGETFATDHWKSYGDFVPPEQHQQMKAATFTVAGHNSRIRRYLVAGGVKNSSEHLIALRGSAIHGSTADFQRA